MGRHRRSAAAPTAEESAERDAGRSRGDRRRKRSGLPVRTGLLGVSAAMAVGAVAVASGLLPGGDNYLSGGSAADQVRSQGAPDLLSQGGSTTPPADRHTASDTASRGTGRADGPTKSSPSADGKPSSPSRTSGPAKKTGKKDKKKEADRNAGKPASAGPSRKAAASKAPAARATKSATTSPTTAAPAPSTSAPAAPQTTAPPAAGTSAQAAVLSLVNQERAKVGCSPVTASGSLASLAQNFSDDMAARGFFDHTDPDGKTPWDRAAKAGVDGLGGENIARGQADAQAVMDAWMNSDGHRANILNCDYKTLGVGVHFGSGGPWWTQDFGF
ncbi:CAP domain-containing protein [Streptomyces sp. ITFR-6]|uniref:CAP domain-containing protein n=1 Tax=Streptomyces sp. ITFR-6 TaxID=3075197 RepID=UPI002889E426|nr:CAP domain-containing protein [Streptomyces sp. ITFR-6]WNI28961.1 CAP domain-containing protein [Streptomyces sp. ITFR-6]